MSIHTKLIQWNNEQFLICNERVIYWQKNEALILSDLHIGKAAHFRRNGIPLPIQIHQEDINRLERLINYFEPKRVIIVRDMLHANDNIEVQDFKLFIQMQKDVDFILIKGNHDRMTNQNLLNMGLSSVALSYKLESFVFLHEPLQNSDLPQIVGHIHPGLSLMLPTKRFIRLPAFIITPKLIVLPAFSNFTGLDTKSKFNDAKYYACYEQGIVEIT